MKEQKCKETREIMNPRIIWFHKDSLSTALENEFLMVRELDACPKNQHDDEDACRIHGDINRRQESAKRHYEAVVKFHGLKIGNERER